jgi:hypothetical protein
MKTIKIFGIFFCLLSIQQYTFSQSTIKPKIKFNTSNVKEILWTNSTINLGTLKSGNKTQAPLHLLLKNTIGKSISDIQITSNNPKIKVMAISKLALKTNENVTIELLIDNDTAGSINTDLTITSNSQEILIHITGTVL